MQLTRNHWHLLFCPHGNCLQEFVLAGLKLGSSFFFRVSNNELVRRKVCEIHFFSANHYPDVKNGADDSAVMNFIYFFSGIPINDVLIMGGGGEILENVMTLMLLTFNWVINNCLTFQFISDFDLD